MEREDKITLKPSIWRLSLVLLVCLTFVIISIFLLKSKEPLIAKIIGGYLSIIFFGGGALVMLYKLFTRKPTITISSKGIYPNYLFKDIQKIILWQDIKKITKEQPTFNVHYFYPAGNIPLFGKRTHKENFLVIYLKNPDKYNFEKYISKNMTEKIIHGVDKESNIQVKGDLYIHPILLPFSIERVMNILKKYPVKIEE